MDSLFIRLCGKEIQMMKIGQVQTTNFGTAIVMAGRYRAGQAMAVQLLTEYGEPLASLSVNIPGRQLPGKNCFYVKTWFENEQLLADLRRCSLFVDTGMREVVNSCVAEVWMVMDPTKVPPELQGA